MVDRRMIATIAVALMVSMMMLPSSLTDAVIPGDDTLPQDNDSAGRYYDGQFLHITYSIHSAGTTPIGGTYDSIVYELVIDPITRLGDMTASAMNGGAISYQDIFDIRISSIGEVFYDNGGHWISVSTGIPDPNMVNPDFVFIAATPWLISLISTALAGGIAATIVAYTAYEFYNYLKDKNESEGNSDISVTYDEIIDGLTVYYQDGVATHVHYESAGVELELFENAVVRTLDPWAYYPVMYVEDTYLIAPIVINVSKATELMSLDSELYHLWTATPDWAQIPANNMYGLTGYSIHGTGLECGVTFGHFHGIDSDEGISNSMSFYGLVGGDEWSPEDGSDDWKDEEP